MNIVPKWDKRTNQRKIDKFFEKILDTNYRMNKGEAEKNLSGEITKPVEP